MTHAELVKSLLENQDLKYRDFHASLLPNIDKKSIIGVRVPVMRKIAKEFMDSAAKCAAGAKSAVGKSAAKTMPKDVANFLDKLPHKYFEENQVHLLAVEKIKDADECLRRIEQFLPYINNWAVCDGKSPKALLKDEARFLARIKAWLKSSKPYTVRLDENLFDDSDTGAAKSSINAARPTDRYYVQMVIAWYFATALAKQWDSAFPYVKNRKLSPWIHAKTIQKACESYRITDEQKKVLRALK